MEENEMTANTFSAAEGGSAVGALGGNDGAGPLNGPTHVNKGEDKKSESVGRRPKAFVFFFVTVLVASVIMIVMHIVQYRHVSQTHERIIKEFERAAYPDTVLLYSSESFKSMLDAIGLSDMEKASYTLLGESLIKDITQNVEANATQDGRVQALLLETKSIVEVELARIQQEYESMQIWYGLLTVVFLLFSFFSLYKTDELVGKCNDGVKRAMEIETTVQREMLDVSDGVRKTRDSAMVEIKQYKKEAKAELGNANKEVIKSYSNKIASFEEKLREMESQINGYSDTMNKLKNSILNF